MLGWLVNRKFLLILICFWIWQKPKIHHNIILSTQIKLCYETVNFRINFATQLEHPYTRTFTRLVTYKDRKQILCNTNDSDQLFSKFDPVLATKLNIHWTTKTIVSLMINKKQMKYYSQPSIFIGCCSYLWLNFQMLPDSFVSNFPLSHTQSRCRWQCLKTGIDTLEYSSKN